MQKIPFNPVIAGATLLALVLGLGVYLLFGGDDAGPKGANGAPVVSSGVAQVGGPFTLVDQTGKSVTDKDLLGRYSLIYFGFTFCPVICPTELQVMAGAMDALGPKAENVTPILISIDPERDTPEVLAPYVKQFHPRLVGLTGTPEQIAVAAKAYRVYYNKVVDESSSAEYTMDHSSIVYLMDPQGKFVAFFPSGTAPEKMAERIQDAMDGK